MGLTREINGVSVIDVAPAGAPLASEGDARDLIALALESGARMIAIPTSRLAADFFDLETRNAGGFIQKLVNYRVRLAIVGDISGHLERSRALKAFVAESNKGDHVWFVDDDAAFVSRLSDENRDA